MLLPSSACREASIAASTGPARPDVVGYLVEHNGHVLDQYLPQCVLNMIWLHRIGGIFIRAYGNVMLVVSHIKQAIDCICVLEYLNMLMSCLRIARATLLWCA